MAGCQRGIRLSTLATYDKNNNNYTQQKATKYKIARCTVHVQAKQITNNQVTTIQMTA